MLAGWRLPLQTLRTSTWAAPKFALPDIAILKRKRWAREFSLPACRPSPPPPLGPIPFLQTQRHHRRQTFGRTAQRYQIYSNTWAPSTRRGCIKPCWALLAFRIPPRESNTPQRMVSQLHNSKVGITELAAQINLTNQTHVAGLLHWVCDGIPQRYHSLDSHRHGPAISCGQSTRTPKG